MASSLRLGGLAVRSAHACTLTRTSRLSSWAGDMTRNLKIKAIAFDLSVIIDAENGERSCRGEAPVLHESSSGPAFSKPVRETFTAPLTRQAAVMDAVPPTHTSPAPLKLDVPLDPKVKYAQKLNMKLAKSLSNKVNQFGPTGLQATALGTASRWLLAEGMGDVLDYSFKRTLRLAAVGAAAKYQLHTIEQLRTQLRDTKLAYVRPSLDPDSFRGGVVPKRYLDAHTLQSFLDLEEELKVKGSDVMIVSSEESVLAIGRDRGYYTCRFRPPGALYGTMHTDFVAKNAVEIKDSIDDLIGIALRSSVL